MSRISENKKLLDQIIRSGLKKELDDVLKITESVLSKKDYDYKKLKEEKESMKLKRLLADAKNKKMEEKIIELTQELKIQAEKHHTEKIVAEKLVNNLKENIEKQNAELQKFVEAEILEEGLKYANKKLEEKDKIIANLKTDLEMAQCKQNAELKHTVEQLEFKLSSITLKNENFKKSLMEKDMELANFANKNHELNENMKTLQLDVKRYSEEKQILELSQKKKDETISKMRQSFKEFINTNEKRKDMDIEAITKQFKEKQRYLEERIKVLEKDLDAKAKKDEEKSFQIIKQSESILNLEKKLEDKLFQCQALSKSTEQDYTNFKLKDKFTEKFFLDKIQKLKKKVKVLKKFKKISQINQIQLMQKESEKKMCSLKNISSCKKDGELEIPTNRTEMIDDLQSEVTKKQGDVTGRKINDEIKLPGKNTKQNVEEPDTKDKSGDIESRSTNNIDKIQAKSNIHPISKLKKLNVKIENKKSKNNYKNDKIKIKNQAKSIAKNIEVQDTCKTRKETNIIRNSKIECRNGSSCLYLARGVCKYLHKFPEAQVRMFSGPHNQIQPNLWPQQFVMNAFDQQFLPINYY